MKCMTRMVQRPQRHLNCCLESAMYQEHHSIEEIWESPSGYQKTTFRYDEFGRQIESATYDRSGKLLGKDTTEYRNDDHGNWIEKKESRWQAASGHKPAQSRLVSI